MQLKHAELSSIRQQVAREAGLNAARIAFRCKSFVPETVVKTWLDGWIVSDVTEGQILKVLFDARCERDAKRFAIR